MATTIDETRTQAFEPRLADQVGAAAKTPGWDLATERRVDDGKTLARNLGWASLGLGVLEIAATERLCEFLGMEDRTGLVRLYGVREIVKGIGILSQENPENWIKARIAGDVLDLATLATALTPDNDRRHRVAGAILFIAGVTALDVICARQLGADRQQPAQRQH